MSKEKRIVITNKCVDVYTYGVDTFGEPMLLRQDSTLIEEIKTRGKGLNPLKVKKNRENLE